MVSPPPPRSSKVKTKLTNQRSRKHLRWKVTHGTPVSGTDGGNPPTEASSCCLMGRPRSGRSSWAFVCLPACASSCDDCSSGWLWRRWSWSRLTLGRPRGQVVLWCGRTGRVKNRMRLCGVYEKKTDVEDTNIVSKNASHTLVPCPQCTPCFSLTLWDWTYGLSAVDHPLYQCAL